MIGNVKIGKVVSRLRQKRNEGNMKEEEERWWTTNGMVWSAYEYAWQLKYQLFLKLPVVNGHRSLPQSETVTGVNLGTWVINQRIERRNRQLSVKRIQLLDQAKMLWSCVEFSDDRKKLALQDIWDKEIKYQEKKTIPMRKTYVFPDGKEWRIGDFFHAQKKIKKEQAAGKKR
ncbi:unnamed protein product, partial [Chrysoparadoxa australica]